MKMTLTPPQACPSCLPLCAFEACSDCYTYTAHSTHVSEFSDDNRSGINNSLHRISALRNRKLQIIGLTCRVGRAVSGSAEVIRDLVEGGGSILVIGPPGVGKTTLIREIARMLADDQMKRVVIVDTSNEIGGDGDVPHAGIGRARRMQVPNVNMQHNETTFIEQVVEDERQMESMPTGCSKVMNWHLHLQAHSLVYPKGWQLQKNLDIVLPIK